MEPYPALDGCPDFNRSNWERRDQWPLDWQDKVFMGRAIDALGKAMFGNEWTGRDPEGGPLPSLPKTWAEAPGHLKAEVAQITARTREAVRAAITYQKGTVTRIGYRAGDVIPELTADEWTQLVERREEYRRRTKASWDRWNKVFEVIASALRGERGQSLRTFGRDGARFIPHEPDGWNIDKMSEPFKTLKLRIAVSWDRAELCWVFFDAGDLGRLVASVTPKEAQSDPVQMSNKPTIHLTAELPDDRGPSAEGDELEDKPKRGRRGKYELCIAEHRRRRNAGDIAPNADAEMRRLVAWYAEQKVDGRQDTIALKTFKNNNFELEFARSRLAIDKKRQAAANPID